MLSALDLQQGHCWPVTPGGGSPAPGTGPCVLEAEANELRACAPESVRF